MTAVITKNGAAAKLCRSLTFDVVICQNIQNSTLSCHHDGNRTLDKYINANRLCRMLGSITLSIIT